MGSCWQSFHKSTQVVIVIVFLGLFSDSMLLTLVDPILPFMLYDIELQHNEINITSNGTEKYNKEILLSINKGGRYGFLVAAKGVSQFVLNPFAGMSVTRFGYRIPMLCGDIFLILSTMAFAYSVNYVQLVVTRLVQGLASSVAAVTGLGILAATFKSDEDRGKVMGIAIGGLSLGIIVGPVFGSTMYQFVGKVAPFAAVAGVVLIAIVLQLMTFKVDVVKGNHSMTSIFKLMIDPYILIVAGNIFLLNLDVSVVLAFLPLRLIELEQPDTWKVGIVVLPTSIGYLFAGIIFPRLTGFLKRWLAGLLGLVIGGGTLIGLAYSRTFLQMLIITTFLGLALGMVSVSMQPIFAHLVDIRHRSVYGNVYALSDMAVCLASFIGPLIGGPVVYTFGFQWFTFGIAVINILYAFLSILLRDPPSRELKVGIDQNYQDNFKKYEECEVLLPPKVKKVRNPSTTSLPATMDLSRMPGTHYLKCLSAVEGLHRSVIQERAYTDPDVRNSSESPFSSYST